MPYGEFIFRLRLGHNSLIREFITFFLTLGVPVHSLEKKMPSQLSD